MKAAYLSQVFLIAFNIWMARYHSRLLKKDKKIKHGLWGGLYVAVCIGIACYFQDVWLVIACFLLRKFLFDTALNLYNGRAIFFVSKETTSLIDRFHYWAFGLHSEIYQFIYFVGWFVLMIKQAV
jgi:hypothetical protein